MPDRPRVALIVEMSGAYGRRILRGIARYLRSHRPWSVFLEQRELRAPPPPWLLRHRWDGIICRSTDRALARAFRRRRIPAIDLNDLYGGLGLPRIGSDMAALGRLGAGHFLERGFRRFAFCGFSGETWSSGRRDGFIAALREAGRSAEVYESPWHGRRAPEWDRDQDRIAKWLLGLPRPVGVLACNDVRGQQVMSACGRAGLVVPEEVAVLGVDDEEELCVLCDPPLSSIVPDAERIGSEAAELLDRLMAGERPAVEERLVPPLGIVTRASTEAIGADDPVVAAAMRLIRHGACSGLRPDEVAAEVAVSRSVLERRFRKRLGRSPQAEIRRVQVERAKDLLAGTELTLEAIAGLCGYAHPEYMSVVFKRLTGSTPGRYRAAAARRAAGPQGR